MAICEAGECSAACDGGCACIALSEAPSVCECICEKLKSKRKSAKLRKIAATSKVTLRASGIPIVNLAWLFDQILPGQIAVPADRVFKRVSGKHSEKLLTDVVDAVGLVFLTKPRRRRKQ